MSDVTRATPERRVLSSFTDYTGAQAAVDRLSDAGFPVEHTAIVGHDVRIVEQVTGRLTRGRAALYGAASGAWFGLLIGLLFGLLAPFGTWIALLLWGLVLGAVWGAVFGFAGHAFTRGRRDFSSVQGFEAEHWDVTVDAEHLARAQSLLSAGAAGEGRV
ncbi:general stress protein [Microbacterium sp. NPDC090007]|uniref:general stress protein n=1 Tax=Microbacterium sp. NPDC090007 TaxID=3364204 RepID=UPI0037F2BA58